MWQVQFPRGWYDIDQDVQAQISSAYQAGWPTVEFATVKSQRLGLYRRYMIDFGRLQQRNLESGRIRAVRLLQTRPDAQPGTSEATEANACNNVIAATLMIEDDAKASSSQCGSHLQPDGGAPPQSTPDAKPGASEITGDNTMASSSHFGSDSQPDGGAPPQSTPDAKPGASEVTGANTSNIVTAATFATEVEPHPQLGKYQTSRMNKIPRTEGQRSPPDE